MANPSIIGHLQNRLKKTLSDTTITMGELDKGSDLYSIVGCQGFVHYIDEESSHNVGLLPFRVSNDVTYWFSLSIQFNREMKKTTHVSASFFDELKFKIFRAEWADNKSKTIHAQPHWHVHTKKLDLNSPLWDAEAIKLFTNEVDDVITDNLKNMHFAMSSNWHSTFNHVISLDSSNEGEIINWIENVLKYTIEQLTYVNDKSSVN